MAIQNKRRMVKSKVAATVQATEPQAAPNPLPLPLAAAGRKRLDPLFQLFEHFLMTKSYEDSTAFTKQLAEQYIGYLDSTPAHVPFDRRVHVLEDLTQEAHEMLVKKMYGCVKASDYENRGVVMRLVEEDEFRPLEFDPQNANAVSEKPTVEKPTLKR